MEGPGACCSDPRAVLTHYSTTGLSHKKMVMQVKGSAEWRFLLGNTLLRMLSHLKLDQVQLQTWQQLARSSQALSTAASRQLSPVKAEEQAALEMLLVMLPEFCMQQAPVLTGQTLSEWKAGRDGLLKQKLAELEIRHARAVGLVLQP